MEMVVVKGLLFYIFATLSAHVIQAYIYYFCITLLFINKIMDIYDVYNLIFQVFK